MDLSLQDGVKGHRERSLKQGRAIRVWNGCAYRAARSGKQDSRECSSKRSFVVISSGKVWAGNLLGWRGGQNMIAMDVDQTIFPPRRLLDLLVQNVVRGDGGMGCGPGI